MRGRRSYKGLLSLPAWGLYEDDRLVATCRAQDAEVARGVFLRGACEEWMAKRDRLRVRRVLSAEERSSDAQNRVVWE